jgi:hypothetical protein
MMHPSCIETEAKQVPAGVYRARVVSVRRFDNAFGPRIGFDFELTSGELVQASAAPSQNPNGKLAELVRGILGRDPKPADLSNPACCEGLDCNVLLRIEANKSGKTYNNVAAVFR